MGGHGFSFRREEAEKAEKAGFSEGTRVAGEAHSVSLSSTSAPSEPNTPSKKPTNLSRAALFEVLASAPLSDTKSHEISRDISRTFPYLHSFSEDDQPGRTGLKKILHAITAAYPHVGYCQGMNFVAGVLLLHCDFDPVPAFFLLAALLDEYDYESLFSPGVPLLNYRSFQFQKLTEEECPALARHFGRHGLSMDVFSHQYIMTIFAYVTDPSVCGVLLDGFFVAGWAGFFSFGLGLMKLLEGEMLGCSSLEQLSRLLHTQKTFLRGELLRRAARGFGFLAEDRLSRGTGQGRDGGVVGRDSVGMDELGRVGAKEGRVVNFVFDRGSGGDEETGRLAVGGYPNRPSSKQNEVEGVGDRKDVIAPGGKNGVIATTAAKIVQSSAVLNNSLGQQLTPTKLDKETFTNGPRSVVAASLLQRLVYAALCGSNA